MRRNVGHVFNRLAGSRLLSLLRVSWGSDHVKAVGEHHQLLLGHIARILDLVAGPSRLYPEAMRLECAMLYVKDFPHMRDLYETMLGTRPVNTEWTDKWALFDLGGARFALHAIPQEYARKIQISSSPKARETEPVKLIFAVDNVPAERNRLEAMGITMLQRPWQDPTEACDAVDPEGNIFQISAARS
jgi:extradiol dioxygenase family protein